MTRVTYIHGIPQDEWFQRSRQVESQPYFNYGQMTDGELKLSLILEQLKILNRFYPEQQQYQTDIEVLQNILHRGLHESTPFLSKGSKELRDAVKSSLRKVRPAAGVFTGSNRKRGLSGLIPTEDCTQYMREVINPYAQYDEITYEDTAESILCQERNAEIRLMNQQLEPSSHHLLYEYLQNPNAEPAVVATKFTLHRNAVSKIAELHEFDRENMSLWLRNGVMRNNANRGISPFPPEETIQIMRTEIPEKRANSIVRRTRGSSAGDGLRGRPKLGGPFLVALPAILQALGAAVAATAVLVSSLKAAKRNEIRNVAQGIGTSTFGPEEMDWYMSNVPGGMPPGTSPSMPGGTGGASAPGSSPDSQGIDVANITSGENLPILILGGIGAAFLLSK
jgi:hypothetical protein